MSENPEPTLSTGVYPKSYEPDDACCADDSAVVLEADRERRRALGK